MSWDSWLIFIFELHQGCTKLVSPCDQRQINLLPLGSCPLSIPNTAPEAAAIKVSSLPCFFPASTSCSWSWGCVGRWHSHRAQNTWGLLCGYQSCSKEPTLYGLRGPSVCAGTALVACCPPATPKQDSPGLDYPLAWKRKHHVFLLKSKFTFGVESLDFLQRVKKVFPANAW